MSRSIHIVVCACGGGGGAFAIKVHEIGEHGRCARLPEHGCNLAAMIGAVVRKMLQRLPDRILVHAKFERLVFHFAIEVALRKAPYECEQSLCLRRPVTTQRGGRLDARKIRESGWR